MMGAGELCVSCGYWVATIGGECESCFDGQPSHGLEACVIAAAIAWRRSLIPNTSTATRPAAAALADAVDALLRDESSSGGEAGMTLRPSDLSARRLIRRGGL
jgi:hypothetical protein